MNNTMEALKKAISINFIKYDRYMLIVDGLKNTLVITLFAVLFGTILGLILALIRVTYDNTIKDTKRNDILAIIIKILNAIANVYITIIRGTPAVIQLMFFYFCIFTSRDANGVFVAIVSFGINSGAYLAEIFRGGIMSIDKGQMEAGRSLGLSYLQTMRYIIIPQAVKVVVPSLLNEFIALIKETSIAGYVAIQDLTRGGEIIRSRTYDAWTPLIAVALIYLALTCALSFVSKRVEERFKKQER